MDEPVNATASTCTRCGYVTLEGSGGVCPACRQPSRTRRYQKRKRGAYQTCQCGKRAVTVVTVQVGRQFDGYYTVRMPLCQECLEIEKAMWEEA